MGQSPIFLYSSWRTGGSALAASFKANSSNMVFYDPLNVRLQNIESAQFSSDLWDSNHPRGLRYFEEFFPLFYKGSIKKFPNLSGFKFRNSSVHFRMELVDYIQELIDTADRQGLTAIFKLEQLEGHTELLQNNFPSAFHIGIVRNPKDQLDSWLEQLALGNSFFDLALSLINRDPEFFKPKFNLLKSNTHEIFEIYYTGLLSLRSNLDINFNIYEDSKENLIDQLPSRIKEIFSKAFRKLEISEQRPTIEKKFIRIRNHSIKLTQQYNELTQQYNELKNSTSWRFTLAFRKISSYLKDFRKRP